MGGKEAAKKRMQGINNPNERDKLNKHKSFSLK